VLEVAQTARIDFTLQLGNTAETVNVEASAAVIETETASTGQVVDNRRVVELPLNGRQFYGLALLAPDTYQPAYSTVGYRGGFNVAGAAETENNFSLNGIDNNDSGINGPTFLPSIDSIQEFRILTKRRARSNAPSRARIRSRPSRSSITSKCGRRRQASLSTRDLTHHFGGQAYFVLERHPA
jgi:hypothetical protein